MNSSPLPTIAAAANPQLEEPRESGGWRRRRIAFGDQLSLGKRVVVVVVVAAVAVVVVVVFLVAAVAV